MALSVTSRRTIQFGSGQTVGDAQTLTTAEAITTVEIVVANGTTDQQVVCHVDFSQLKYVAIHSTQAVTLETVSGSSPTDTISLAANVGKVWIAGETGCPFTADCTNIYVTNASGSSATVELLVGYDPTP